METINNGSVSKEREVIAGIKIIESEYRVSKPIYEEKIVSVPKYVERQVEIPSGIEHMVIALAESIAVKTLDKCLSLLDEKLAKAIEERVKEIVVPKITYKEELNIITKDVPVTNAVITDKQVINAIINDKDIINPILIDKKMINPIFKDVVIERPTYQDRIVINPKFEDIVIQKPKFVEKEIVVIHPKYIDMQGNPEPT